MATELVPRRLLKQVTGVTNLPGAELNTACSGLYLRGPWTGRVTKAGQRTCGLKYNRDNYCPLNTRAGSIRLARRAGYQLAIKLSTNAVANTQATSNQCNSDGRKSMK